MHFTCKSTVTEWSAWSQGLGRGRNRRSWPVDLVVKGFETRSMQRLYVVVYVLSAMALFTLT